MPIMQHWRKLGVRFKWLQRRLFLCVADPWPDDPMSINKPLKRDGRGNNQTRLIGSQGIRGIFGGILRLPH